MVIPEVPTMNPHFWISDPTLLEFPAGRPEVPVWGIQSSNGSFLGPPYKYPNTPSHFQLLEHHEHTHPLEQKFIPHSPLQCQNPIFVLGI